MSAEPRVDVFVSYARGDDRDGAAAALVEEVRRELRRFAAREPGVFFDREPIRSMADWARRSLGPLAAARATLAVLSPAYFKSPYCREEWEGHLERELARARPGERVAPIFIVPLAGFTEGKALGAVRGWLSTLRHRESLELRPWRPEGVAALERDEVRRRVALLDEPGAAAGPTTVPPHNERFVGRVEELRRVRAALALGRAEPIAVVHGLGGMGKSALAFEYAHAFASAYPGGRFLIAAEGVGDLRVPFIRLGAHRGIELTEDERRDLDAACARVRAAFADGPPSLLVLDNVDDPGSLAPERRAQWLPSAGGVHVLVTTRLGPQRLPGAACLGLDALPEPDALRLLEQQRPFADDAEWQAGRQIVSRLGGHALAVETVAVYLGEHPDVGCADYLARLDAQGLAAVDAASRRPGSLVGPLLSPTLDALSPAEALALDYAALLPADGIAVPWVRALVGEQVAGSAPGAPDPWERLAGLRLLTPGDEAHLARMHRLVQAAARARMGEATAGKRRAALMGHATTRAARLGETWVERGARWEIEPLCRFALLLLADGDVGGAAVANLVQKPLEELGRFAECRDLLGRALALQEEAGGADDGGLAATLAHLAIVEHDLGDLASARDHLRRAIAIRTRASDPMDPSLAVAYKNLGMVEREDGHPAQAKGLLQRAIAIEEETLDAGHPELGISYSHLALVERDLGDLPAARDLLARAIAIHEACYPADHPKLAIRYSNLAMVERDLGNLNAARRLLHRAIAINQKAFEPDHPTLAASYSNLAAVDVSLGNLGEARGLLRRALAIDEKVFEPDHPDLAASYSNLATVEQHLGNLDAARALLRRAIDIDEKAFAPDHPTLAVRYSNLAIVEGALGNLDEARGLLRRAIAIREEAFGPGHPSLAVAYSNLATIEQRLEHPAEARELLRRAIAIEEAALGPDHPKLATRYNNLAYIEAELGRPAAARDLMRRAHGIRQARLGDDHPLTRMARQWLLENDPDF